MGNSRFIRLIAVFGLAAAAPSFGGPLQREERAEADAETVSPGQVSALLRRYHGGIALVAVLEALAGPEAARLARNSEWTREDLEAVVAAAERAEGSRSSRLTMAGQDSRALARFLLVERGQLAGMLDDPTIDPVAAARAMLSSGKHRADLRRGAEPGSGSTWAPDDLAALRRFLERLVLEDRPGWSVVSALLGVVGDDELWHPQISPRLAESALAAHWKLGVDGEAWADTMVGSPVPVMTHGFEDADFWVSVGLAAAPDTSFRRRAEGVRMIRCAQASPPRRYTCDGIPAPLPRRSGLYLYETGFEHISEWAACVAPPDQDPVPVRGRSLHMFSSCASLTLGAAAGGGFEVRPRLRNEGGETQQVRVDDRVCDTRRRVVVAEEDLIVLEPSSGDTGNCWKNRYTRSSAPPVHWSRCDGVPPPVSGPTAQSPAVACDDLVLEAVIENGPTPDYAATLLDATHRRYRVSPGDLLCDGWRVRDIAPGRVVLDAATDGPNCFQAAE